MEMERIEERLSEIDLELETSKENLKKDIALAKSTLKAQYKDDAKALIEERKKLLKVKKILEK